jgi:hypothetical protein
VRRSFSLRETKRNGRFFSLQNKKVFFLSLISHLRETCETNQPKQAKRIERGSEKNKVKK